MIIVIVIEMEAVMEKKLKHSRQREALLELLRSVKNHPTADWLYEELRKSFPKISLATVYRNLNILENNGDIVRLDCGGSAERYDGNPMKHYHFICRNCSSIIDVSFSQKSSLNEFVKEKNKLKIEDHALFFYGLCDKCM